MIPKPRQNRRPGFAVLCAIAAVALTAVAGCAGNRGLVYNKNFTAAYSPLDLSGQRSPVHVETFGTPAAGRAQGAVTAATVQGLRDRGPRWANLGYSGEPRDTARRAYFLRVAYGADKAFPRNRLCRSDLENDEIGNDGTNLRAIMALCLGERFVSIAEGSPGADADLESPDFSSFVGLMARQIMPRNNPVLINECIFRRCD